MVAILFQPQYVILFLTLSQISSGATIMRPKQTLRTQIWPKIDQVFSATLFHKMILYVCIFFNFSYIYCFCPNEIFQHPCLTNGSVSTGKKPLPKHRMKMYYSNTAAGVKGLIFSCDQAALQMVFSVCPSVCLFMAAEIKFSEDVRLSVCLSHLFDYVPIIVSSWNFQELLHMTEVRSMQKVKVRGQRSRSQRSQPNLTVSGL